MEEYYEYYERTKDWTYEEKIGEIAKRLWMEQCKPQGKDLEIWVAAEKAFARYYPWNALGTHCFNWHL